MSQNITHSETHALTLPTYDGLREHALAFAADRYSLLILLGSPGLGKSQTLKASLGNREHVYLDNHASAFGLYQLLYVYRHKMVVIDDLDGIYTDRGMIRLIKALCNTDPVKHLRWYTRHPDIGWGPEKVPPEFETTSAVCLIANQWKTLNANIQAIEDRGIVVDFCPNVREVHLKVRDWFQDDVIYDFMEQHLQLITRPSMRYYIHGTKLREAHPDGWKPMLLELMGVDDKIRTMVMLMDDEQYETEEQRAEAFESGGFGSRATYFRWKQKLKSTST